jgi:hypothetical protein
MHLSARDLVDVWEWGWDRSAVDRPLYLLLRALPETTWSDLAALSIGRRNRYLLEIRERLLGVRLDCRVTCPACASELEFALDCRAFEEQPAVDEGAVHVLHDGDIEVRFRKLHSQDLALAAEKLDVGQARQALIRRSLLEARRDRKVLRAEDLPESTITRLSDELERLDRAVAWRLSLDCENCGHEWSAHLDVADYLWSEVWARARHVLNEVHELACAYGWSEAEVLGMSDVRRRAYLELVRG